MVGEVDLALAVLVAHLGQQLPEQLGAEQVDPRVALLDRELGGARVGGLDDARDPAGRVAQHDAGHLHLRRQQDQVGARLGLVPQHPLQGLGAQQRRIAIQDQDVAAKAFQGASGLEHGVAGAALLALEHQLGASPDRRADLLGAVSHHDDQTLRAERLGRRERIVEHRPAGDRVQHLGQRGLHPRPLAGGEQQGGDLTRGCAHAIVLFGAPVAGADPSAGQGTARPLGEVAALPEGTATRLRRGGRVP